MQAVKSGSFATTRAPFGAQRRHVSNYRIRSSRGSIKTMALFGWGKDKGKEEEKEEMWRAQQKILEERRSGKNKAIQDAFERRQALQVKADEKKAKKRRQREALARGEGLIEDEEDFKKPYNEEEEGGIIIPIAPFGIPKFDQGERFDLRLPYVDEGWVDEDADPFKWAKNLFGGKKDKKKDDTEGESKKGRKGRK